MTFVHDAMGTSDMHQSIRASAGPRSANNLGEIRRNAPLQLSKRLLGGIFENKLMKLGEQIPKNGGEKTQ